MGTPNFQDFKYIESVIKEVIQVNGATTSFILTVKFRNGTVKDIAIPLPYGIKSRAEILSHVMARLKEKDNRCAF